MMKTYKWTYRDENWSREVHAINPIGAAIRFNYFRLFAGLTWLTSMTIQREDGKWFTVRTEFEVKER